ncbi:MAG: glucose-6-phosphate dehydrogenase [Bacillota bacterium]
MKKTHFVIFGGTGDLACRKLLPAVYDLLAGDILEENFEIVAIGRSSEDRQDYLEHIYPCVQENVRFDFTEERWQTLAEKIVYLRMDITEEQGYKELEQILSREQSRRIFYLALAPSFFEPVVERLDNHDLVENATGISRLVIEKPFGRDFKSAKKLNDQIREVFPEDHIYRIDHYLGKEMLQNMMVIRFANILFEPLWNHKYIDNVQIVSTEKGGVGQRGAYYDRAGALRDMVQNHMMQLLTISAMEPPAAMDADSIRDEKVKILKSLKTINHSNIDQLAVRGQYVSGKIEGATVSGYREKNAVPADSGTETFVALKLFIDSLRWQGVPFYLKTGKRLPEKLTQIVVEFKDQFHPHYKQQFSNLNPDLLVIRIQPRESVFFKFNAKEPGPEQKIIPVQMDFCQNCIGGSGTPGAYERLIKDFFAGDSTLFTRWDEVETSWKFVDRIIEAWEQNEADFPNYDAGSPGPKAATDLLTKDDRHWWQVEPENRGVGHENN